MGDRFAWTGLKRAYECFESISAEPIVCICICQVRARGSFYPSVPRGVDSFPLSGSDVAHIRESGRELFDNFSFIFRRPAIDYDNFNLGSYGLIEQVLYPSTDEFRRPVC
jgi:hypothetical protein